MSDYVTYPTPPQWQDLVGRDRRYLWTGEAAPVDLTVSRHVDLCQVHDEIRRDCPYKLDFITHGRRDYWTPADENGGDCEDLALARWTALMRRGWQAECLSLALCEGGVGYHAVLVVLCQGGLVVLDNLAWLPAACRDLTASAGGAYGYRWIARSHGAEWVSMSEGRGLEEALQLEPNIRAFNRRWNQSLAATA